MQKNFLRLATGTGLVLLIIPVFLALLALWHWRPGAMILGALLMAGGAGVAYELVEKKFVDAAYRCAVGIALGAALLLFWMNASVGGILGDNPANMMYFGVLLIGLVGGLIGRLKPVGMSRALFATAFAMMWVPAVALYLGVPAFANGVPAVFGLHAVFALLFVCSAILFRRAGFGNEDARALLGRRSW